MNYKNGIKEVILVRISYEGKCEMIPVAYQMMFVSMIKEALKNVCSEYYKKIYLYNEDKNNKKSKNFCFSVFMKNFEMQQNNFIVNDRVIFNISSPDYEFMVNVYNGLQKMSKFQYKNFEIEKITIRLINERKIASETTIFNTLSPICVKDKDNNMIDISHSNYVKELNYISNKVLENFRGRGLKKELQFMPIDMRKKIVKEDIKAFKDNTNREFFYVNAYAGRFALTGDIEDLRDIYMLGLGFKRNQGFGMLEVLG